MFDIWLKTSSQIVQEIIDESDLKTIVSQKINNFKKIVTTKIAPI